MKMDSFTCWKRMNMDELDNLNWIMLWKMDEYAPFK